MDPPANPQKYDLSDPTIAARFFEEVYDPEDPQSS